MLCLLWQSFLFVLSATESLSTSVRLSGADSAPWKRFLSLLPTVRMCTQWLGIRMEKSTKARSSCSSFWYHLRLCWLHWSWALNMLGCWREGTHTCRSSNRVLAWQILLPWDGTTAAHSTADCLFQQLCDRSTRVLWMEHGWWSLEAPESTMSRYSADSNDSWFPRSPNGIQLERDA